MRQVRHADFALGRHVVDDFVAAALGNDLRRFPAEARQILLRDADVAAVRPRRKVRRRPAHDIPRFALVYKSA